MYFLNKKWQHCSGDSKLRAALLCYEVFSIPSSASSLTSANRPLCCYQLITQGYVYTAFPDTAPTDTLSDDSDKRCLSGTPSPGGMLLGSRVFWEESRHCFALLLEIHFFLNTRTVFYVKKEKSRFYFLFIIWKLNIYHLNWIFISGFY